MASMTPRPRYDMEVSSAGMAGTTSRALGKGRVVARFLNRIGTAVPAFDMHEAFVEHTNSLPTGERARRLFDEMAERSQIEDRCSFLQLHLTDSTLDTTGFLPKPRSVWEML
jgi:hypothetical protein